MNRQAKDEGFCVKVIELNPKTYFTFTLGPIGYVTLSKLMTMWLMFSLAPPDSTSPYITPAIIGLALMISQIVDGLVDPFIGILADRTPSRRRILGFAIFPMAIFFILGLLPPQIDPQFRAAYLVICLCLFRFFYSLYQVPFESTIPLLSQTLQERQTLSTRISFGNLMAVVLAAVVSGILIERIGFKESMFAFIAITIFFMAIPVFFLKTKIKKNQTQSFFSWGQIRKILKDRTFVTSMSGVLSCEAGYNILIIAAPFLVSVVLGKGESWNSIVLGSALFFAFLGLKMNPILLKKLNPKKRMTLALAIFFIFFSLIGLSGLIENEKLRVAVMILSFSFCGIAVSIQLVLTHIFLGQCIDRSNLLTKTQKEGAYYGFYHLFLRIAVALSTWAISVLFSWKGSTFENPTGILLAGPLAAVFILFGFLVFRKFRA